MFYILVPNQKVLMHVFKCKLVDRQNRKLKSWNGSTAPKKRTYRTDLTEVINIVNKIVKIDSRNLEDTVTLIERIRTLTVSLKEIDEILVENFSEKQREAEYLKIVDYKDARI